MTIDQEICIIELFKAERCDFMTVIVCVDDRMAMMFGKRRQSQDVLLRERVLAMTAGQKLWMNAYTAKQFVEHDVVQITVDEMFLDHAAAEDFCFVENLPMAERVDTIDRIILYRWNRHYPGNRYFDLPLDRYRLESTTEFVGNSHEKITEEIYIK